MGAISVLASEGLAAALNASRADVWDMIDGVEQGVAAARERLTTRLDQVLASAGDSTDGIERSSRDFLEMGEQAAGDQSFRCTSRETSMCISVYGWTPS